MASPMSTVSATVGDHPGLEQEACTRAAVEQYHLESSRSKNNDIGHTRQGRDNPGTVHDSPTSLRHTTFLDNMRKTRQLWRGRTIAPRQPHNQEHQPQPPPNISRQSSAYHVHPAISQPVTSFDTYYIGPYHADLCPQLDTAFAPHPLVFSQGHQTHAVHPHNQMNFSLPRSNTPRMVSRPEIVSHQGIVESVPISGPEWPASSRTRSGTRMSSAGSEVDDTGKVGSIHVVRDSESGGIKGIRRSKSTSPTSRRESRVATNPITSLPLHSPPLSAVPPLPLFAKPRTRAETRTITGIGANMIDEAEAQPHFDTTSAARMPYSAQLYSDDHDEGTTAEFLARLERIEDKINRLQRLEHKVDEVIRSLAEERAYRRQWGRQQQQQPPPPPPAAPNWMEGWYHVAR